MVMFRVLQTKGKSRRTDQRTGASLSLQQTRNSKKLREQNMDPRRIILHSRIYT